MPVDFAASGLSAMSIAAHKFGGPTGVGALLLRRDTACVPLLHGGGQERDVRSGTPDVAGAVAMAAAAQVAVDGLDANRRPGLGAARPARSTACWPPIDDVDLNGADGRRAAARQHALHLPRLRGRRVADAVGRQGNRVLDRFGVHGRRRAAVARADRDGRRPGECARIAATVVGAHQHRRRRRRRARRAARGGGAGPAGRAGQRGTGSSMRVLVAMSGGVDSSVAAARMVDAGHDVVGVHLALSSAPGTLRTGSRGCCSKEDAGDARRVADILDIPFYVWDFADRFKEDVIDDFVASYARGETPNPCVRCNEKIKFSALSARALALGFDALATGHYARLSRRPAAPRRRRRQGPVLRARRADRRAAARTPSFPIGDTPKPQIREEAARARPRRRRQAGQPRHLLHPVRRHPGVPRRAHRRAPRCRRRRGRHRARRARRRARVHHRAAQGPRHRRARARRPPALRDGDRRRERHRARRRRQRSRRVDVWSASGRCSRPGRRSTDPSSARFRSARTAASPTAVVELRDGTLVADLRSPLRGVAPGQTMVLYRPDPDGDEVLASATIASPTAALAGDRSPGCSSSRCRAPTRG